MPSILHPHYDQAHRGRYMAETGEMLTPLRLRSHEAHDKEKMPYNEKYTPYIAETGLLPFIQLVSRSTPPMNPAAITALVDRWRPETHTFHLRMGEMTVTLQDMSMILALPIEGEPVCFDADSSGGKNSSSWRETMLSAIGKVPPVNKSVPAGATYTWIAQEFGKCPEDAGKEVIEQHARAYLWYVLSRTLFADGGGRTASWIWLKALTGLERKSWGTAALAYLYRQLDDACRRKDEDAGIGGPLILLSVWMWEHFSIGRPKLRKYKDWEDHRNPLRMPTWAYMWDVVGEFKGDPQQAYTRYVNEFDTLTADQVNWQPYGGGQFFGKPDGYDLNPKCTEEAHLWLMQCPLICVWAVEFHLPQRVMTQFGLRQYWPPEWKDTSIELHGLERKYQKKVKDWGSYHHSHIIEFNDCVTRAKENRGTEHPVYSELHFTNYLSWFLERTRVELRPPAFDKAILEEPADFEQFKDLDYNRLLRDGRQTEFAPLMNFVREEITYQADQAELAVELPRGKKGESALREYAKSAALRLRRLGGLLGCRGDMEELPAEPIRKSTSPTDCHGASSSNNLEVDGEEPDEAPDDSMTLMEGLFASPRYKLHTRKIPKRWTPEDFLSKKKKLVLLQEVEEEEDEEEGEEEEEEEELPPPPPPKVQRRSGRNTRKGRK